MKSPTQDTHLVYLLTRDSDGQQYVGITIKRRLKQRLNSHRRSERFIGDGFQYEFLFESSDRLLVEQKETEFVQRYDTFANGLNDSPTGKGYGHCSPNFTTLGFAFTPESREKMSISASARCDADKMREISKDMWATPGVREHHIAIRKGKRLSKPKLSDKQVDDIRKQFSIMLDDILTECAVINTERTKKNKSWSHITPEKLYAVKFSEEYGVSITLLRDIVANKTRIKVYPHVHANTNT